MAAIIIAVIVIIAIVALFFITTSTPVIHNDIPTPTFNLDDVNDRIDGAGGNDTLNGEDGDDVEWYSQECEPKVRATGKKWDADTLARKEKNMKAKNSKAKGNFKPWQH